MKQRFSPIKSHGIQLCLLIASLLFSLIGANSALADIEILMFDTAQSNQSKALGTVVSRDTEEGLLLIPKLIGLPPGLHGFHIHQNKSCDDGGNAAGGHFDPENTSHHLGPYSDGHLGDLPPLYVDSENQANLEVLAPRLKEKDLHGHSLMIHAGGDNYADEPQSLGGGGARIACGIINPDISMTE